MPEDSGSPKRSFLEKIFKTKSKALEEQKTEEEILSLVEEGREKGYFKDETENFIKNVFDFGLSCYCIGDYDSSYRDYCCRGYFIFKGNCGYSN